VWVLDRDSPFKAAVFFAGPLTPAAKIPLYSFFLSTFFSFDFQRGAVLGNTPIMKFGHNLSSHQVPEWSAHYIDYKGLKKLIKSASESATQNEEADIAGK
jgi:hypothetical protein